LYFLAIAPQWFNFCECDRSLWQYFGMAISNLLSFGTKNAIALTVFLLAGSAILIAEQRSAQMVVCDSVDRYQNRYQEWRSRQYLTALKSQLNSNLQNLLANLHI
jgi:hypothetical protein